jgi:NAD(P)-dependent dehydrogenase (short-subunit alcohol dehydrogenase family)
MTYTIVFEAEIGEDMELKGKIALITGGSTGIGFSIAQRFVREGSWVFIVGRRQAELDKAMQSLGANAQGIQGDITITEDLERVYATIKKEAGRLDIVVANSGVGGSLALEGITGEHFDKIFDLNARATVFTVQKALPLMTTGGSVILVGSVAGSAGLPGHTAYNASKAAVRSFARTWTSELAAKGIRVNTISPGPIDTGMMQGAPDAMRQFFISRIPLGRLGKQEEVAAAALFLASDESSFIAGTELVIDGGMMQV